MAYCYNCGRELAEGDSSCPECRTRVVKKLKTELRCGECDSPIRDDYPYCPNCGLEFENEYNLLEDINSTLSDVVNFIKERPLVALITLFILIGSTYMKVDFARDYRAPLPGQDDEGYHRFGLSIAGGKGFPGYYYEPGFSYFLGMVYYLFGGDYVIGRLSLVLLSVINAFLLWKIAKLLFNDRVAWASFVISLVDLDLFFHATNLYNEMLLISVLLVGFYCMFIFRKYNNLKSWIVASAAVGFSLYLKAQTVFLIPAIIIWLLINLKDRKHVLRLSAILLAAVLIIQLPWFIRNYNVSGGEIVFVSTNSGVNFWIGNNPYSSGCYEHSPPEGVHYSPFENLDPAQPNYDAAKNRLAIKLALEHITAHPDIFIQKINRFLTEFWFIPTETCILRWYPENYLAYAWPLWILTLAGVALTCKRYWKQHSIFYLYFAITTVTYMVSFYMQRYKVPLIPFEIMFASYAIINLLSRVKVEKKHADYWKKK
ncbi:MAG: glycosyltransferase family 39 protein [Candidatus Altiarchaeota archaeon]